MATMLPFLLFVVCMYNVKLIFCADGELLAERCITDTFLFNGTCIDCPAGFFGVNCSQRCPVMYYGERCTLRCTSCTWMTCGAVYGCRQDESTDGMVTMENSMDETSTLMYKPTTRSMTIQATTDNMNTVSLPGKSVQTSRIETGGISEAVHTDAAYNSTDIYNCMDKSTAQLEEMTTSSKSNYVSRVQTEMYVEGNLGQNVYLHCTVESQIPLTSFYWIFCGRENETEQCEQLQSPTNHNVSSLASSPKYKGGTILNPSLFIHNVSKDDEGYYGCVGTNAFGHRNSSTFLQVNEDLPRVQTEKYVEGNLGHNVYLHCTVESQIPLTSFYWIFCGQENETEQCEQLQLPTNHNVSSLASSPIYKGGTILNPSLFIHNVSKDDEGYYGCVGTNAFGHRNSSTFLQVNEENDTDENCTCTTGKSDFILKITVIATGVACVTVIILVGFASFIRILRVRQIPPSILRVSSLQRGAIPSNCYATISENDVACTNIPKETTRKGNKDRKRQLYKCSKDNKVETPEPCVSKDTSDTARKEIVSQVYETLTLSEREDAGTYGKLRTIHEEIKEKLSFKKYH